MGNLWIKTQHDADELYELTSILVSDKYIIAEQHILHILCIYENIKF
jgi:hypothetical protein